MNFLIDAKSPAVAEITTREADGLIFAEVKADFGGMVIPSPVKVMWKLEAKDCYSVWSPAQREGHSLQPEWCARRTDSDLTRWMPLHQLISASGRNRMTVAVSDVAVPISISTGICVFDACFTCEITFFTRPTAPKSAYSAVIRLDLRDMPYYECIGSAAQWWENSCGYTPAYVPEAARLPVNSLWYSMHHSLNPDEIVRQCRLSKKLGMETVIIDDGWQMEESESVSGVYARCGDWEPAEKKIGDIHTLISRIHETGMKAVLWFSVPFVGINSRKYGEFKDMILYGSGDGSTYFAFDPRYSAVRDYLTDIYIKAVRDWGLDGLKLDFIDSFTLTGRSLEEDPQRDFVSLEDAVDALMSGVREKLTALNPDIMIEFRQSYIGPAIRKYGNMLRVGDCPLDAIKNRQNIVDMRLTSGKTAVHSDMLMWNYDDSVESAAIQLASVLYSVPQISVLIDRLPDGHYKMLDYYLKFWLRYRAVLLDGHLSADHPESNYSSVSSELDGIKVTTVYTDSAVDCNVPLTVAVNAGHCRSLIFRNCAERAFRVVNCMGEKIVSGTFCDSIAQLEVPIAGMAFITE